MAETGTVGLPRAETRMETRMETEASEPSKEELQQRMDEARHAISGTVTDIKNSVVHQYEVVKDTLDWREQVKRRPIAWSAGALGGGLLLGYGITSVVKGHGAPSSTYQDEERPQITPAKPVRQPEHHERRSDPNKPGLMKQIKATPAFKNLQSEGEGLAKSFVEDLSRIGHEVLLPAISGKIRNWLNDQLGGDNEKRRAA